jgi:hypothetical protein
MEKTHMEGVSCHKEITTGPTIPARRTTNKTNRTGKIPTEYARPAAADWAEGVDRADGTAAEEEKAVGAVAKAAVAIRVKPTIQQEVKSCLALTEVDQWVPDQ